MINIVETIQKNLGYPSLNKIDPNTQDVKDKPKAFQTNSVAQAAIPAVLSGLFNYIIRYKPDKSILQKEGNDWLQMIFGDKLNEMVENIASYGSANIKSTKQEMEFISNESLRIIRENINETDDDSAYRFAQQHKNEVLHYLPASLRTGELLGNNNLDDRTNKMEGPVSSLMHSIEKNFS